MLRARIAHFILAMTHAHQAAVTLEQIAHHCSAFSGVPTSWSESCTWLGAPPCSSPVERGDGCRDRAVEVGVGRSGDARGERRRVVAVVDEQHVVLIERPSRRRPSARRRSSCRGSWRRSRVSGAARPLEATAQAVPGGDDGGRLCDQVNRGARIGRVGAVFIGRREARAPRRAFAKRPSARRLWASTP